jgi:hypothetical protein
VIFKYIDMYCMEFLALCAGLAVLLMSAQGGNISKIIARLLSSLVVAFSLIMILFTTFDLFVARDEHSTPQTQSFNKRPGFQGGMHNQRPKKFRNRGGQGRPGGFGGPGSGPGMQPPTIQNEPFNKPSIEPSDIVE